MYTIRFILFNNVIASGVQASEHLVADALSVRWGGVSAANRGRSGSVTLPVDVAAGFQGASSPALASIRTIASLQRVKANEAEYQLTGQPSAARTKHIRWILPPPCASYVNEHFHDVHSYADVSRRGRTPVAFRPYSDQEPLDLPDASVAAVIAAVCADGNEPDALMVTTLPPLLNAIPD